MDPWTLRARGIAEVALLCWRAGRVDSVLLALAVFT